MPRKKDTSQALVVTDDGRVFGAHEQPQREQTQQEMEDERLLAALAMLGGSRVADEDLIFDGERLIIPKQWTARDALEFLENHIEQQEEPTVFRKRFNFRPLDGAHALQLALKRVFGTAGLGKPIWSFFGVQRPELVSVQTGVDTSVQVPWGRLEVPLFGGTLHTGSHRHKEYGPIFEITVEAPRKFKAHVEGLFLAIEAELRTNSLYKGQAVTGAEEPEFLDLRGVDPRKVVYSDEVRTQIEANVWTLLEHTQVMRDRAMPLKRAVLFEGDYGTGKTLGAFLTAQIATQPQNGWTFVYCRPGRDDFETVMATARLYQPAVVFFEDVDTIASSGDKDHVSRLLDTFDGITAKGTELVCILTTNHPDRIVKGMVRPGRLDAVIHFGGLDVNGIQQMAEANLGTDTLAPDIDWEEVGTAMGVGTDRAFLPAFAKEALDRAWRYALARSGGDPDVRLSTHDLVSAASGLAPQLDLMLDAGEGEQPDTMAQAITRAARKALQDTRVVRGDLGDADPDHEAFAVLMANGDSAN